MSEKGTINRRRFMAVSAPVAAFTIVPRPVLGGTKFIGANDKIRIGYVGTGTQGIRQLIEALPKQDVKIVSVCDPNTRSADYVEWSKNEIRDKIRDFLNKPNWGEGVKGCCCGRLVGKEIVDTYYAKDKKGEENSGCSDYSDFREMLEKESDLDAVYIMTPDHLHATIAIAAMKKGKHVITHKAISNIFHEICLAVDTASQSQVATHLFCASGSKSTATLCEWIWGGAIGPVREVHNWSSRPVWPQGMTELPKENVPVPKGMEWDLWLGPVPHRPYHPSYTHAVFRGWYDFGAGALGDMGHYSFYQIFKIMKLGSPISVEASRSQYWAIVGQTWKKQVNTVSYPRASLIHWEFPAREDMPPLSLYWYDGGLRPPLMRELEIDNRELTEEGLLFVGDNGKIFCDFMGGEPRLIPEEKMRAYQKPPETLPRPTEELDQWIRACKGEGPSDACFANVYPFSETIALGNIALRVSKKLKWDTGKKEFTNSSEANELRFRKYRPGWEL